MPIEKNQLSAESQPSIVLQNRGYKILTKLGEGTYAKVYHSEFQPDGLELTPIQLAVKVINNQRTKLEFNKKFLPRELYILSRLNHPHIIHVHSILKIGESVYIFMRFAEQGDLLDFILRNGIVNENQARVWTRQIALGLQYLHEMNIAHRDMKCENILVTANYNVKISDFGFARYAIDPKRRPIQSETYCGSLSYCSPEILQGRPYNPKMSDMWSFGVIIYVMLNKSMPYDAKSPKALHDSQMLRTFKFRSKVSTILSKEVKTLVQNLLEPDPMKRYAVEGVVNSDWIAMDKRLAGLKPLELDALMRAFENRIAPPENFSLEAAVIKCSAEIEEISNNIDVIKKYQHDMPRLSENSRVDPPPNIKYVT